MDTAYGLLADFSERPEPFSRYTTDLLWTDPHIAARMLDCHLNPDNDLASRRPAAIDAFVDWLDRRFALNGKRVCDLGCGPGLYAMRMARRGARVTGLDFSATALHHARAESTRLGLGIEYRLTDYLRDELPGGQDVIGLIYGDYCTLSPDRVRLLLGKIRAALAPGGAFVFDVFPTGCLAGREESTRFAHRLMDGFWAAGDYFGFQRTFLYPDRRVALDRYLIVAPGRTFEVFNWMRHHTPATITAELGELGFDVVDCVDVATGGAWTPGPAPFAVIARPRPDVPGFASPPR